MQIAHRSVGEPAEGSLTRIHVIHPLVAQFIPAARCGSVRTLALRRVSLAHACHAPKRVTNLFHIIPLVVYFYVDVDCTLTGAALVTRLLIER